MASTEEYPDGQKTEPHDADGGDPGAAMAGIRNRIERHSDGDGAQAAGKIEQVIGEGERHRRP